MKPTKKGVGDKRTKECKRCFNASPWVCLKCQQMKEKVKEENKE